MEGWGPLRAALPFLMLLALACGGEDAQSPGSSAPVADRSPPPAEVLKLVVRVQGDPIGSALEGGLSRSGFQVATDEQVPHDVTLRVAASKQVVPSFFHVQVNGREQVKVRAHVMVSVLAGSQMVDQVSADMEMNEGDPPPEDAIGRLVVLFAKSPRLAEWARGRQAVVTDTKSAAASDDSDWYKLNVTACKVPPRLDACDGVRAFLVKWPDGAHAGDARAALDQAQPALEKLQKDDNDWKAVRPDECKRTKTRDACEGVEVYLTKYPAGLHTDEAKRLLGK
jgi:hypothetical protein